MSNLQDFVRLVARMRMAQRDAKWLGLHSLYLRAESLEREVDKMLEQMGFEGAKIKQMRLDALDSKRTDEESGTYDATPQK